MLSGEATNTNFIKTFDLTRGEHANQYTIDVGSLTWETGICYEYSDQLAKVFKLDYFFYVNKFPNLKILFICSKLVPKMFFSQFVM